MACFVNLLKLKIVLALGLSVFLFGCATSDSALRESGHVEAYLQGFHDGRHSGMREAGNYFEHIVKDAERFQKIPNIGRDGSLEKRKGFAYSNRLI